MLPVIPLRGIVEHDEVIIGDSNKGAIVSRSASIENAIWSFALEELPSIRSRVQVDGVGCGNK
jgi:hypothetical protein